MTFTTEEIRRSEGWVSRRRRVAMLGWLVGIQISTAMVILGIPPLITAIRQEFHLSRGASGLMVTAAFLGVVAASWPGGRIVNAVGVRRSAHPPRFRITLRRAPELQEPS